MHSLAVPSARFVDPQVLGPGYLLQGEEDAEGVAEDRCRSFRDEIREEVSFYARTGDSGVLWATMGSRDLFLVEA